MRCQFKQLILLLIFSGILLGQDFTAKYIKNDLSHYPALVSSLQIYDKSENPIKDLNKNNFSIRIDGNNGIITDVITYQASGKGVDITLCIDLSGTMKGAPLQNIKSSVNKFIDEMRGVDKLSIIGFSDDVELISDFTSEKEYLKSKIDALEAKGTQTSLYYALNKGLQKLINNDDQVGKVLIVMSDGKDDTKSSSYTEEGVITLAQKESIPVFTLGYSKIDKVYLRSLEKISEETNGKYYDSPNDEDLEKKYKNVYEQILNIYLLSISSGNLTSDGMEHNSVITVTWNNIDKTVSKKFTAPAKSSIDTLKTETVSKDNKYDVYYLIGGLLLILLIVGSIIITKKIRNKKRSESEKISDKENIKSVEENIKKPSGEVEIKSNDIQSSKKEKYDKTIVLNPKISDRTMVLRNDSDVKRLVLEIVVGSLHGSKFEISSSSSIGRGKHNNIVLNDNTVSTNHAKIIFSNGNISIEDLNSTNGTYINGNKIIIQEIQSGDVFKFGACEGRITIIQ